MRVTTALAGLAVVVLAGCVPGEGQEAASGGSPSTDVPPAPATTAAPRPDPSSPPATKAPPRSTPTPDRGGGPADKELPEPLPLPNRAISGTVQRVGPCTVLLVGQRRWALLGPLAAQLKVGQRVRISGPPARVPSMCRRVEVYQAIQVARADSA
jgi:hypothetical protein